MTPARKGTTTRRRRTTAASAAEATPDAIEAEQGAVPAGTPRRGAKRTVMDVVMQLPHYLRLLFGLLTDRRVEALDKMLVVGAIAYILSPLDFIPDFLPFFGQVDDAFLLLASLERLISNAGRRVVLDHWHGPADALSSRNLQMAIVAASFFLPRRLRRRLRGMVAR